MCTTTKIEMFSMNEKITSSSCGERVASFLAGADVFALMGLH